MTESDETRRKRLLFRSWHRGMREADLVLGNFAARHLAGFDEDTLDRYELLLAEDDQDVWRWLTGAEEPPAKHAGIMGLVKSFRYET